MTATARQCLSCSEDGWPALFLVEAVAQLGGIVAAREGDGSGILASIDRAEFHDTGRDGDVLTITVRIIKSFGPLHLVAGEVTAADRPLASATVTLKVVPL
ncbi:hypothetical protein GURASL_01940 [Geotalea uraniireducens]|uniref:Uncharacterized protein n=1 Tax=Geotalea uraniireducens TaxID=351604 RepID=A0ABN6VQ44_9BACT|nr:hotdog domain-containing protein [Geotalea uraniireducens]BDV41271.1 hypothetical protein GURASL_01940 [Geotalea uraniireducens]